MTGTDTLTDLITVRIDGKEISVPKGTLIIRAAEKAGVHIPRFCDHPLLKPVAACRQCLVEVAMPNRQGEVAKMPKPQPACAMTVAPKMEVYTAAASPVSRKAQHGVMEFLLINHPMDCPVCDKAGECPLQNQALGEGRTSSRFTDVKRTYPKPVALSPQILLDRDRCILCQRCTRFSRQIAGDVFIQLQGRGGGTPGMAIHSLNGSQIGSFDAATLNFSDSNGTQGQKPGCEYVGADGHRGVRGGCMAGPVNPADADVDGKPFASYFSGNVIQICPVGALTSASYRFRARPFDLVSVPSVTEHDASGAAIRVDYRRGTVVRRLAGEDPEVNEDWITDKDRFAFRWQNGPDRLRHPRVSGVGDVSWPDALETAAAGLRRAKNPGVIIGGRLTLEDAYAYAKFARVVLGTNNIDFRTRAGSVEENDFLAAAVAGRGLGVTYADVESAGHVAAVGLEAEDECGSLFLRLRKGVLAGKTSVTVISAYETAGTKKMRARFIPAAPGDEARILNDVTEGRTDIQGELYSDLCRENSVLLIGERTALVPGALSAALDLARRTGAKPVWVPRRAGDRGAVDAGALPNLLPGGRPVTDRAACVDTAAVWGVDSIPQTPGMTTGEMLKAAKAGEIDALLLAGVEDDDLPQGAPEAMANTYVVQLEVRDTPTAKRADVLIPVAPPAEKGGTFVNWEGRMRPFGQVLASVFLPDRQVINELAAEMGVDLHLETLADVVREYVQLQAWDGARVQPPSVPPRSAEKHSVVLATWKQMLDGGSLQSFEPHLARSARLPVAVMSPETGENAHVGRRVEVVGRRGSFTYDTVFAPMPPGVVWVPQNAVGRCLAEIGIAAGDCVEIKNAEVA